MIEIEVELFVTKNSLLFSETKKFKEEAQAKVAHQAALQRTF